MAAALEAENARLKAEVEILRRRTTLSEADQAAAALMLAHRLTRGEAEVLAALLQARPRPMDRWALIAALSPRDHARARGEKLADVMVSKLRARLGPGVIETVPGAGWRIAPDWAAAPRAALAPS